MAEKKTEIKLDANVLCYITDDMTEDDWKKERNKGIGGSDAATALGILPWKSPMQLFLEKTGAIEQPAINNEKVYWGKTLEPILANRFAELNPGFKVEEVKAILQSKEYPFMIADLDRVVILPDGQMGVLEIKTADSRQSDKWEDESIPVYYTMQVQHYLAVTGLKFAWIVCLLGGNTYIEKYIERDDELIEQLIKGEQEFWLNVTTNTPPKWDGSEASNNLLNSMYPKADTKSIDLSLEQYGKALDDMIAINEKKKELSVQLKELDYLLNAKKQIFKNAMGLAELANIGDYTITWKNIDRKPQPASHYRDFRFKKNKQED